MRITNSMIMNNAGGNINGTKVLVDKRNTQMTTQKKIQRPSEDPVIAVRSLRLQTTLSKVNQYYEKNIPDAESWMNVTETALSNIKDIITDMRTLANRGATETLTQDDRNTILSQMKALQEQVYNEGNADYAGRTVFTGYRTDKRLTFVDEDLKTSYNINEPLSADSITRNRYYTNQVTVPTNKTDIADTDSISDMLIEKTEFNVMRLAYDKVSDLNAFTYTKDGMDYTTTGFASQTDVAGVNYSKAAISHSTDLKNENGGVIYTQSSGYEAGEFLIFENEADWASYCKAKTSNTKAPKKVGDTDIVMIKETGELILGDKIASHFLTDNATFSVDYYKKGFQGSELRPEYYFDCVQLTDSEGAGVGPQTKVFDPTSATKDYKYVYKASKTIDTYTETSTGIYKKTGSKISDPENVLGMVFDKQDELGNLIRYDINYTVAQNQDLTVNLEAGECINHNIYQDMGDMISAVEWSIEAHNKVDKIKSMMKQDQYADETSQAQLTEWLDAAQKEADYYDDNLSKMYSEQLGICDEYLEDVNLSITKMGCKGDQLAMTKTRMSNQQETVQGLQSTNDDMDLSNIILRYTAAYTAYQSSLTAAGKLGQQTLLNYI